MNQIIDLTDIYREKGENQIFKFGLLNESDYNEEELKKYLNNIKFEKSFYLINSISDLKELKSNLTGNFTEKNLKYYNINYLYGEFSHELKTSVKNNTPIANLTMRKINPYYSGKYEKDTPCYKKTPNICKELNELDFEKEEFYKGTLLEDNEYYMTYYQIDKSSESFSVNAYLEFDLNDDTIFKNEILFMFDISYINYIISELELNKLDMVSIEKTESGISFEIYGFTDNIEKIIKDLIEYLKREPKKEDFKFLVNKAKYKFIKEKEYSYYFEYLINIFGQFTNDKSLITKNKINIVESMFEKIKFENMTKFHNMLINNIETLTFKIAGNIDKN